MDTTYRLSQTGKEVQELLDQVTPNKENIATESERAQQAEQQLQDNIDAIGQGGSAAVTAERERAQAAEQTLQGNIDTEAQARTDADTTLQGNIDAEAQARQQAGETLDGKIATETSRAEGAEQTLQDNIDAEAQARQQADETLDGKITTEKTRAEGAEQTLQDNIDAEASARTTAISDEAQARTDADETLDGKITTEKTRAEGAEGTLRESLSQESTARQQADTNLQQSLAQETSRAQQAELTNAQSISTEAQARTAADTTILDNLQAEARTRLSADTDLQEHIADEETRAKAAEQQLQDNIDAIGQSGGAAVTAERERALAAEQTLQDNIDAEAAARTTAISDEAEARTAADETLDGKITTEKNRAEGAEKTLQDNIDAEAQARTAAIEAEAQARTTALSGEAAARTAADTDLQEHIDDEETRAKAAEQQLQDNIDAIGQSGGAAVTAERERALAAEQTLQDNIDAEASARTTAISDEAAARTAADEALDSKITTEKTRAEGAEQTLQDDIDAEAQARTAAIEAEAQARTTALSDEAAARTAADETLDGKITTEKNRAEGAEKTLQDNIDAEAQARTTADTTLQDNIDAEAQARQQADTTLQDNIDTEAAARAAADTALDNAKQDKLTFDEAPIANSQNPVKSQGIRSAIDQAVKTEETRAKAAEQVNSQGITDLKAVVPTQASAQNQLADKDFVNSSIASSTGKFQGNYNLVTDLHLTTEATPAETAVALLTAISQASNNDYCFVQVPSSDATPDQIKSIDRYKFDGTKWQYEYSINNSSFTAEELAAIQSGITSPLVQKLDALYTKQQLDTILDSKQSLLEFDQQPTQGSVNPVTSNGIYNSVSGKQDTISDLATIRSGAAAGATAYQKPATGIPATDLSESVQTSLGKADTALQEHQSLAGYATTQDVTDAVGAEQTRAEGAEHTLDGKIAAEQTRAEGVEGELSDALGQKQDTISDLATIRSGAAAGATAYQKPAEGIPAADLSESVQTSLGKADTALQEHQSLAGYATTQDVTDAVGAEQTRAEGVEHTLDGKIAAEQTRAEGVEGELSDALGQKQDTISDLATIRSGAAAGATAYQKPATGIPATDLSESVQTSLGKADTALQEHQSLEGYATTQDVTDAVAAEQTRAEGVEGELSDALGQKQDTISDLAAIRSGAAAGATAYQKPAEGIPATDLSESVQTSLGKADTALQEHQSLEGYATTQDVTNAVAAEQTRAEGAEQTLQGDIDSEAQARQQADTDLTAETNLRNVTVETTTEPAATDLTYTMRGTQRNHIVGDKRIYTDTGGERHIYFLVGIASGEAIWQEGGGGSGSVQGKITVSLAAMINGVAGSSTLLNGATIQLMNTTQQQQVGTTQTWAGQPVVFSKLTPLENYRVVITNPDSTQWAADLLQQDVQNLGIGAEVSVAFELKADEYTVSVNNADGRIIYGGNEYADGQTFRVAAGTDISASLSAKAVTGYTVSAPVVSGKTITAVYTIYPVLTVTTLSNQTNDSTIAAVHPTVKVGSAAAAEYTSPLSIAPGETVVVTWPSVTGYAVPTAETFQMPATDTAKSGTYTTMRLTVTLGYEGEEAPDLTHVTTTVTDTTASAAVTPSGGVYLIPGGHGYKVEVSDDVEGYKAPDAVTGTATSGTDAALTVTMTYEEQAGFVDLGLPSGLKWAQGNIVKNGDKYEIGAETDYGAYFSWGNIVPHFSANGSTFDDGYDFGTSNSGPYASTPGHSLSANIASNDAAHDAALALLGSPWHMPTKDNFQELYDNTDREWTTIDGVNGWKFMKKTDHSVYVFFPAAGYGYGASLIGRGSYGSYWSASWYSADCAYSMYFDSSTVYPQDYDYRYYGNSVRAVQ